MERLKTFSGKLLVGPYKEAIDETLRKPKDDQEWIDHLTALLENKDLAKELSQELYAALNKRYAAFWH